MALVQVNFRWDEDLVAAIDAARDEIPRSAYVRRAVEQRMASEASATESAPPPPAARPRSAPASFMLDRQAKLNKERKR